MGYINEHDIGYYIKKYNLTVFVETGTYTGGGVAAANEHKFDYIYSIELLDKYFEMCIEKFKDLNNIKILKGNSSAMLPEILLKCENDKILFWLDAHLPQLYGMGSKDKNIVFPLENELRNILNNRDISNDVFIIDDLRIYEDGLYKSGNCPAIYRSKDNINFIYELFEETHIIKKDYRGEGYIILEPKIK